MEEDTGGADELVAHRVDRRSLARLVERGGTMGDAARQAISTFDRLGVPDGTPFLLPRDGDPRPVADINDYLVSAVRYRALTVVTAQSAAYHLLRALRFVRGRHEDPVGTRLLDACVDDLAAYGVQRRAHVSGRSWRTELSALRGYFRWAVAEGLIERSPVEQ